MPSSHFVFFVTGISPRTYIRYEHPIQVDTCDLNLLTLLPTVPLADRAVNRAYPTRFVVKSAITKRGIKTETVMKLERRVGVHSLSATGAHVRNCA